MSLPLKQPLISVCIPMYNSEKFIKEAVFSVLEQSYSNIEIIIVDDCSSDGSVSVVQNIKDSKIKLIMLDKNSKGPAKPRNIAVKNSNGEFIALFDSDDIMIKDRLKKQLIFMQENPNIGLCGGGYIPFEGDNTFKRKILPKSNLEIKTLMLFTNPIANPTIFAKATLLKDTLCKEEFNGAEDYEMLTRLLFKTDFANLKEPLIRYRLHSFNMSKKHSLQHEKFSLAKINLIDRLLPNVDYRDIEKFVKNSYTLKEYLMFLDILYSSLKKGEFLNFILKKKFNSSYRGFCKNRGINGLEYIKQLPFKENKITYPISKLLYTLMN